MFRSDGRIIIAEGKHSIGELFKAVEAKVPKVEIVNKTVTYDMPCLIFNVRGVQEDVAAGLIAKPVTFDDWVDAITNEFMANLAFARK